MSANWATPPRVYLVLAEASWMPSTSRSARSIWSATTGRRVVHFFSYEVCGLSEPLATRTLKLPTASPVEGGGVV